MNRGPENLFGKAPGRFDEMMARRMAASLPDQAIAACAAMDDPTLAEVDRRFGEAFGRGTCVGSIEIATLGGKPTTAETNDAPC